MWIFYKVQECIATAQQKQKRQYEAKNSKGVVSFDFHPGQEVLKRNSKKDGRKGSNLNYYFYPMAYEDCDTIVFTHSVCMAWCVVRPHFLKLLESTPRFYPTALKGCRGIVSTHGVRMGGRHDFPL